jgi:hypothetical protein
MIEIILFFLLLVKHTICDIGLQSQLLWGRAHEKGQYFGGHHHYIHHSIGSFIVFICFLDLYTVCVLTTIDYLAHWHIDFTKHRVNGYFSLTRKDIAWWWTTAIDQLLHFLTYFLIILYGLPN